MSDPLLASPPLVREVIQTLSLVLDLDEHGRHFHGFRVALLAYAIGEELHARNLASLWYAGLLHDVGAVGLSEHIIHHARAGFTDLAARRHAEVGARILRSFSSLQGLADVVEAHHEHTDGTGFPRGISGAQIPEGSSVLLCADVVEILLRDTPPSQRQREAASIIKSGSGTRWPKRVGDAARRVIDTGPDLLADLFDDAALSRRIALAPPLPLGSMPREQLLCQLLWLLARVVDAKHATTMGHSARVAFLAQHIAEGVFGIEPWDAVWGGLLHDLGKARVPRALLEKEEPLTREDRAVIRRHATDTFDLIEQIPELAHLARAASSHHEQYDGHGYPLGLAGDEIPLLTRVLTYADIYDGITSERPYRAAISHAAALEHLKGQLGRSLDPNLADVALPALARFGPDARLFDSLLGFERFIADGREPESGRRDPRPVLRAHLHRDHVLLPEPEPWERTRLVPTPDGPQLSFEANSFLRQSEGPLPLAETFEPESVQRLLDALSDPNTAPKGFFAVTTAGSIVELLVQDPDVLLFRRADGRTGSLKQMAAFHRLYSKSHEAMIFTDVAGRIIDVNTSFLDLYGYDRGAVIGKTPRILSSGRTPREVYADLWSSITDPHVGAWRGELIDIGSDGTERFVELTISSVHNAAGTCVGYLGRTLDISKRRAKEALLLERERQLSERNEELERRIRLEKDVVVMASHDLRSPLFGIASSLEMLQEGLSTLPEQKLRDIMSRAQASATKLSRFVDDVLDLAKADDGRLSLVREPARVCELLNTTVQGVATLHDRVRITTDIDPTLPAIMVDPPRLEQVFLNLLSNAVKFSPLHGQVDVRCERGDTTVRITVEDQGPGIPPADLDRVFERYHQTNMGKRAGGTGLGLSIVRTIVALHGGRAFAGNRSDGGARFVVELPRERPMRPTVLLYGPPTPAAERFADRLVDANVHVVRVEREPDLVRRLAWTGAHGLICFDVNPPSVGENGPRVIRVLTTGAGATALEHLPGVYTLVTPVVDSELHEMIAGLDLDRRIQTTRPSNSHPSNRGA